MMNSLLGEFATEFPSFGGISAVDVLTGALWVVCV